MTTDPEIETFDLDKAQFHKTLIYSNIISEIPDGYFNYTKNRARLAKSNGDEGGFRASKTRKEDDETDSRSNRSTKSWWNRFRGYDYFIF